MSDLIDQLTLNTDLEFVSSITLPAEFKRATHDVVPLETRREIFKDLVPGVLNGIFSGCIADTVDEMNADPNNKEKVSRLIMMVQAKMASANTGAVLQDRLLGCISDKLILDNFGEVMHNKMHYDELLSLTRHLWVPPWGVLYALLTLLRLVILDKKNRLVWDANEFDAEIYKALDVNKLRDQLLSPSAFAVVTFSPDVEQQSLYKYQIQKTIFEAFQRVWEVYPNPNGFTPLAFKKKVQVFTSAPQILDFSHNCLLQEFMSDIVARMCFRDGTFTDASAFFMQLRDVKFMAVDILSSQESLEIFSESLLHAPSLLFEEVTRLPQVKAPPLADFGKSIMREAHANKTHTIPFGVKMEVSIGPFCLLQLFEFEHLIAQPRAL